MVTCKGVPLVLTIINLPVCAAVVLSGGGVMGNNRKGKLNGKMRDNHERKASD